MEHKEIKIDKAPDECPRYKLRKLGVSNLTNSELLTLILGPIGEVGNIVLSKCKHNLRELGKLSLEELETIPGMGSAKASAIAAVLEFGRRRHAAEVLKSDTLARSSDIAEYLKTKLQDSQTEIFGVIFLNRANKVKGFEIISQGGITGTVADPRIILKRALELNAVSLVLTHNHPSGSLQPSKADEEVTKKIKEAAKYFEINVLDHIIVSENGYYSFADDGIM